MIRDGAQYEILSAGLADHLQSMLIGLTAAKAADLVHLSEENKRRLTEQMKKCKDGSRLTPLLKCIDHLNSSNVMVHYGQTPELALQKWFIESIISFRR